MKTVALTFGDGLYIDVAARLAERFQQLNDIEAYAVPLDSAPALTHPAWIKAWLWSYVASDVERIVWLDADMVPLEPIVDLLPNCPVAFAAVADATNPGYQTACWSHPDVAALPVYFNAGFFVAHRKTEPMFEQWKTWMDEPELPFWDQTPLNLTLHQHFDMTEIATLSEHTNWMFGFGAAPAQIRMLHLAGLADPMRVDLLNAFSRVQWRPQLMGQVKEGEAWLGNW